MDHPIGIGDNLLQNPGFENDLAHWRFDNAIPVDTISAEGTQAALLGPGVASLYQEVNLGDCPGPLFLSLIAYTQSKEVSPGNLVVQVIWMDAAHRAIGTGLSALLTYPAISHYKVTFFDVTDMPPVGAVWAALQLSKGGEADTAVTVDQILLTSVLSRNLVSNPGFQLGLQDWTTSRFAPDFANAFEGVGSAGTLLNATLSQDIPIQAHRPKSYYLLSFAVKVLGSAGLTAQLVWLDASGNPIGAPGIDTFIPAATLEMQGTYLTYLFLSDSAPAGTAAVRILFTANTGLLSELLIDQVLLLRVGSGNLVQNPGFADGFNHWTAFEASDTTGTAYVGDHYALLLGSGGALSQVVSLPPFSAGRTFLWSFGLLYSGNTPSGNLVAQVHWLDAHGNHLGLGCSLTVLLNEFANKEWLVYTAVTERAPLGASSARIQFSKSFGVYGIGVDHVLFALKD